MRVHTYYVRVTDGLNAMSPVFPPFFLRILLAWEFGEAGYNKLTGSNWFGELSFPFPFSLLPVDINWQLATGFELLGATALAVGLFTRFFSLALIIITLVAIASVHWPEQWSTLPELWRGYRILDEEGDGYGNYKLPVIYLLMLLPLVFGGAGKLSLDHLASCQLNNGRK